MPTSTTSQTLGERQLAIYLTKLGVDPKLVPPAAYREIVDIASGKMDFTSIRNSQGIVMYMGLLKQYSTVIADYCTKPPDSRTVSDQAIWDILGKHGVLAAT